MTVKVKPFIPHAEGKKGMVTVVRIPENSPKAKVEKAFKAAKAMAKLHSKTSKSNPYYRNYRLF